ncbi:D-2-hydroxyacid dehydrogenase [Aneurinibacillus tyrosinisolvens]|uniref:D-2-hydroxyacid dehydrogenase n=1 Tax=Aneurinibacillus tyrosinisolvens TaxID=1443435 RepID=UPI00063F80FE|nr:D-2-hydroxyacid dehydrogenase [Aneurinibacillus tyrosinisolvens]
MKIVSTAKMGQRHQHALQEKFAHHDFHFYPSLKEAGGVVRDAEILITYGEDLTPERVMEMTRLHWIQVISAGLDIMPLPALGKAGVIVTNASGIHKIPMAEYTFAVLLQVAREMNTLYENQKNKKWDRTLRVEELYGKTMGIIGVGAIGEEIARRAKVFGMQVLGVSRSGHPKDVCDEMHKQSELLKVLPRCDYVVIAVPLTEETRGLLGKKELEAMRQDAVLINIARGEVVDEKRLIERLVNKQLKAAVLDVFSQEPLPETSPIWELDNCIITPHISGRSPLYMERAMEIFHQNLDLYDKGLKDEMINKIDCRRGY